MYIWLCQSLLSNWTCFPHPSCFQFFESGGFGRAIYTSIYVHICVYTSIYIPDQQTATQWNALQHTLQCPYRSMYTYAYICMDIYIQIEIILKQSHVQTPWMVLFRWRQKWKWKHDGWKKQVQLLKNQRLWLKLSWATSRSFCVEMLCCSALKQCVAVCLGLLQCVAVSGFGHLKVVLCVNIVLQCVAGCSSKLQQYVAARCSALQCLSSAPSMPLCVEILCCSVLQQSVAAWCSGWVWQTQGLFALQRYT